MMHENVSKNDAICLCSIWVFSMHQFQCQTFVGVETITTEEKKTWKHTHTQTETQTHMNNICNVKAINAVWQVFCTNGIVLLLFFRYIP